MVAVDSGPGIADLARPVRDGSSTAGTLGIGMGAIERMAHSVEIATAPERGTVLVARFDLGRRRPATPRARPGRRGGHHPRRSPARRCAATPTPPGRTAAGVTLMVADGSGHGPLAASASSAAVRAFLDHDRAADPPAEVLGRVHGALSGTRGAAVAVAEVDPDAEIVRFAGVGNIAGAVLSPRRASAAWSPSAASPGSATRRSAPSSTPTRRARSWCCTPTACGRRWSEADVRGLVGRAPLLLAATLLRDAGIRHDDACVLVGRAAS